MSFRLLTLVRPCFFAKRLYRISRLRKVTLLTSSKYCALMVALRGNGMGLSRLPVSAPNIPRPPLFGVREDGCYAELLQKLNIVQFCKITIKSFYFIGMVQQIHPN